MAYNFVYRDCAVCGSNTRVILGKRVPRSYQLDEKLITTIAKCKDCGLIYPCPFPIADQAQLKENYSNPNGYFPQRISKDRLRFYDSVINRVNRAVKKRGRLLDVGCGRGELLHVAKQYGWDAVGQDISGDFAAFAKDWTGVDVRVGDIEKLGFPSNSFDAVTAIAMLYYVYDPAAFMHEINRVLRKDGVLFIEVMNNESILYKMGDLFYRLQGKQLTTNLSPTFPSFQIYGFSSKSISCLLGNTGFKIEKMWTMGGVSRTERPKVATLQERLLRILRAACAILAKLLNSGQVLFVCARKKEG